MRERMCIRSCPKNLEINRSDPCSLSTEGPIALPRSLEWRSEPRTDGWTLVPFFQAVCGLGPRLSSSGKALRRKQEDESPHLARFPSESSKPITGTPCCPGSPSQRQSNFPTRSDAQAMRRATTSSPGVSVSTSSLHGCAHLREHTLLEGQLGLWGLLPHGPLQHGAGRDTS